MLILEIAAGVVLGLATWHYWRPILATIVVLGGSAVVLGGIAWFLVDLLSFTPLSACAVALVITAMGLGGHLFENQARLSAFESRTVRSVLALLIAVGIFTGTWWVWVNWPYSAIFALPLILVPLAVAVAVGAAWFSRALFWGPRQPAILGLAGLVGGLGLVAWSVWWVAEKGFGWPGAMLTVGSILALSLVVVGATSWDRLSRAAERERSRWHRWG